MTSRRSVFEIKKPSLLSESAAVNYAQSHANGLGVCAQINSGTALLCRNTSSVELDLPCQRPLRIGCETCMLLDKQAVY